MKRIAIIAAALAIGGAMLAAGGDDLSGTGRVVDGDTLDVGRTRVRLCGIDAPEAGDPGYARAAVGLAALAEGRGLRCLLVGYGTPCDGRSPALQPGTGRYRERVVAQCFVGGVDVAMALRCAGLVEDAPRFSGGHYAACDKGDQR